MSIIYTSALLLLLLATPVRLLEELPEWLVVWATPALLFALYWHSRTLALKRGDNPWIDIGPLLTGWVFLRYGMGALVVYYWDQYGWTLPGVERRYHIHPARENLVLACALAMLAGLAFYLGTRIPVRGIVKLMPDLRWPLDHSRFQRNVMLYAPFGLFVLLFLTPRLPLSVQFIVSLFATITYALVVMISYWWFTAPRGGRLQWAVATLSICLMIGVLALLTGQVGQVFVPFMMVLFGYALAHRTLPWRTLIPAVVAAFLFVAPFLTVYKYSKWTIGMENPTVQERIEHTAEVLGKTEWRTRLEMGADRFIARMALIEFPAIFSAYYPNSHPFANGYSLFVEFGSLVPRFLWPDKPQMSLELNKYSMVVGIVSYKDEETSAVFDAVSEYYVNFGSLGVIVLCAIHALYLKVLYEWFLSCLEPFAGVSIHLLLFLFNFDFFGVGQLFVSHIKTIPVAIMVLYVLGRQSQAARVPERVSYART